MLEGLIIRFQNDDVLESEWKGKGSNDSGGHNGGDGLGSGDPDHVCGIARQVEDFHIWKISECCSTWPN